MLLRDWSKKVCALLKLSRCHSKDMSLGIAASVTTPQEADLDSQGVELLLGALPPVGVTHRTTAEGLYDL